ncbi:MAG: hypothetical protein MZV70_28745 [Desulfobacterales bacterium]|nr:hypothetical protein [Desulfobacterales bacterium]
MALTFDACATKTASGYDEEVIRVLVETRTPATPFPGREVDAGALRSRPAGSPRSTCSSSANHSFLHPHMTRIPDDQVRQELEWTQIGHVFADRTAGVALPARPTARSTSAWHGSPPKLG